jgi:hypothetical protein
MQGLSRARRGREGLRGAGRADVGGRVVGGFDAVARSRNAIACCFDVATGGKRDQCGGRRDREESMDDDGTATIKSERERRRWRDPYCALAIGIDGRGWYMGKDRRARVGGTGRCKQHGGGWHDAKTPVRLLSFPRPPCRQPAVATRACFCGRVSQSSRRCQAQLEATRLLKRSMKRRTQRLGCVQMQELRSLRNCHGRLCVRRGVRWGAGRGRLLTVNKPKQAVCLLHRHTS